MNCKDCAFRKWYAIVFDIHFDYKDCPRSENCAKGGDDQ